MIRRQRKAHLRAWIAIAVLLPMGVAVILALASREVVERAPQRLSAPAEAKGAGG